MASPLKAQKRRTTAPPQHADHGATGPAMLARPSRLVDAEEAGVRYRQMEDVDPLDAMDLTGRQMDAAKYLRDLWRDCLPAMEMPSCYTRLGNGRGERHLTHDEWLAAQRAWQDYRKAMERVTVRCSHRHASAIRTGVIEMEPAPKHLVREGLETLADLWRMK